MDGVDLKSIPPERWAGALAMAILAKISEDGLRDLVLEGKAKFVKTAIEHGAQSERFGLKREHYEQCYSKLARRAKALGLV
jgi:hypothetical protein